MGVAGGSEPPPNILSIKYSFLLEVEISKWKFKITNILNFVHAWENKLSCVVFSSLLLIGYPPVAMRYNFKCLVKNDIITKV